ncbi:GIY-YIG nuclease family protein [Alkalihalobacillus pseudalcaliphilus]|uniref:GIY-YIG nuclease family protein n=1 Tax=Alkalihalobacillus pseudalcaliphilus TaxID=79884 RepID=UPI00064D75C3|nr:GIY-YIG nuclease family protein [Alkalihalobacillus pseudalcaliphilus]KMK74468.1 endonuclease [Alkalihalobacillus pseudalcaliphilus]
MKHIVYVLACNDGTWYTGYTNDFNKRLRLHQAGKGAKYTRGRGPFELVHMFEYETRSEALKAEYAFKKLSRKQKEKVVAKEKGEAT